MKLPTDMVERAAESLCNSIGPEFDAWRWDRIEGGEHHKVQWRIDASAALEAALSECTTGHVCEHDGDIICMDGVQTCGETLLGLRVALVPLDD